MKTLKEVYKLSTQLDWYGKDQSQVLNARRILDRLGWSSDPSIVDSVTLDNLVLWLRQEGPGGSGCSNATINRYLAAISVMLKRALRAGMIETLPLFPERKRLREAEPRDLVIKREWLAELVELLGPGDLCLVQFLYHVGCRINEALDLTWDRVEEGAVQFVGTKTHKPRRIPLSAPAREALDQARALSPARPFPASYDAFRYRYCKAVAAVCNKLGLSEQTQKEWTIHSLRHTCLTNLAAQGCPLLMLQKWAGHSNVATTQRYIHLSDADLEQYAS